MIHTEAFRDYVHSSAFLEQLDLPAGTKLDFAPLGQGEYNANFSFIHPLTQQKLVLRINTGSQMHLADQIGYEFAALQALEGSGRTPKALFCDNSRAILPYGTLVMEWLPGRALRYERDLTTAAEIFADIHAMPVPAENFLLCPAHPAKEIYDECLAMAEQYLTWDCADREACRLLETLIREIGALPLTEGTSAARCIVNTEVNSGNFLINDGGKSYLIDWEKPLLSEPAQDLGHFLVPTTTFWKTDVILTTEEISAFLRHYLYAVGDRMDTSVIRQRLPLFFTVTCLRGISWCAMALREYASPDRAIVNGDTLRKIRQYVATDFMENILHHYVRRDFLKGVC